MHNAPNQASEDWLDTTQSHVSRRKIMFYCQSSLGVGHTMRSLRLVSGMSEHFDVCFINGAEAIEQLRYPSNINIVPLPPLVTDAEFSKLSGTGNKSLSVDELFAIRRDIMLQEYHRYMPDVLVIELYPFGRNAFSSELLPLLRCARSGGTKIICSLRDIVVNKRDRQAYEEKVVNRMNEFFDLLLVHGDPKFIPLEETFTRLSDITAKIMYTGYVAPNTTLFAEDQEYYTHKKNTIVASIGGGRFGHELAEAVVRSAPILKDKIDHKIKLYTGPFCPDDVWGNLQRLAYGQTNITINRFTDNLHEELLTADLSISLGGYNTTMDVLSTGVRALMMPCVNNGGMDQALRLQKLSEKGVIELLSTNDLEPHKFADKISSCLKHRTASVPINLSGVSTTRQIISKLFKTS